MTSTKTKSTERPKRERRKAERQVRNLRIYWRVLGSRDFRFGEAALKDICTDGLAMQVDRLCAKGTVVIVQFDGTDAPLLSQAAWSRALPSTNAGAAKYVMGCAFTAPLQEKDLKSLLESAKRAMAAPPKEVPAKTSEETDPFLVGSAQEKRSQVRRGGLTVSVVLSRAEGGTPVEASVVDRSLKGLGILSHLPFTRGSLLNVRPRNAQEKAPSIQVQVRNCQQQGKQWLVGCFFTHTPPANVLMLLG